MDDSTSADAEPQVDDATIMENKVINEEYKIWRKNAPLLYDTMYSRALDWPTLTVQWFPDVTRHSETNQITHRLLLGTHTSNDQPNYLQIASFSMPLKLETDLQEYDEERGEIGGHGAGKKSKPDLKLNVVQKIDHDGEVNKARYMPQNPDLIATMCNDGRAMVFDRTKLPSQPTGTVNPQIELVGHTDEGFALCWNPGTEGQIATGSNDNTVKLWNIQDFSKTSKKLKAEKTFKHHSSVVNDIDFHPLLPWMLGTVSDDLSLQILDLRKPSGSEVSINIENAHNDAINSVTFNPGWEYFIVTGSADKTVAMWDLRCMKTMVKGVEQPMKVHAFEHHRDAVTQVEWHPTKPYIFASSSYDRRIRMWDLSRVANEQTPEDAEDGPPELIFMHGGHTSRISDFSWNKNDPGLVCSAAEDNLIQIWKTASVITEGKDVAPTVRDLEG